MTPQDDDIASGAALALRRLLAVVGEDAASAGASEAEVAEAENRLGYPLPAPMRVLYRTCGGITGEGPGYGLALWELSRLAREEVQVEFVLPRTSERHAVAIVLRTKTDHEFAVLLDDPRGVAERSPKAAAWKHKRQPLFEFVLERAAWQVALGMPYRFAAHVPRKATRLPGGGVSVQERVAEAFTPLGRSVCGLTSTIGVGDVAFCDEKLGVVLVRADGTSEEWTIGAATGGVRAALERRLGVPVVPEGEKAPPPRAERRCSRASAVPCSGCSPRTASPASSAASSPASCVSPRRRGSSSGAKTRH